MGHSLPGLLSKSVLSQNMSLQVRGLSHKSPPLSGGFWDKAGQLLAPTCVLRAGARSLSRWRSPAVMGLTSVVPTSPALGSGFVRGCSILGVLRWCPWAC
jgi:hypothetical protein